MQQPIPECAATLIRMVIRKVNGDLDSEVPPPITQISARAFRSQNSGTGEAGSFLGGNRLSLAKMGDGDDGDHMVDDANRTKRNSGGGGEDVVSDDVLGSIPDETEYAGVDDDWIGRSPALPTNDRDDEEIEEALDMTGGGDMSSLAAHTENVLSQGDEVEEMIDGLT